jgi:hypothetical protein
MLRPWVLASLAVFACGGPPVTAASQSAPPDGQPFVPTVSGHRLALWGDTAVVLDPEGPEENGRRPQVDFVSISGPTLLGSVDLPLGANPQAVEVADGWAYVLAAGLGGVYAIDIARRELGPFAAVCAAPSDLAMRGSDVLVVCRTGELVTLSHSGRSVRQLEPGLLRIGVDGDRRVFIATASAHVIDLDRGSTSAQPVAMPDAIRVEHASAPRRLLPLPSGGAVMLFQQNLEGELVPPMLPTAAPSPYAGGIEDPHGVDSPHCAVPAARPAFAMIGPDDVLGAQRWTLATLAVDGAVSPDGNTLAVADVAHGDVRIETLAAMDRDDRCFQKPAPVAALNEADPSVENNVLAQVIPIGAPSAVTFSDSTLVVLNADPALEVVTLASLSSGQADLHRVTIRTKHSPDGFRLFHADPRRNAVRGSQFTNSSLACASCHPDGLSNGGTTTINTVTRRVMPLAGHLANASLLHWEAQPFHDAVVQGTWQTNMGGFELTPDQEASLHAFVGQLQAPARPAGDGAQVAAGTLAFAKAGCDTCHVPSTAFTNDSTADVGRGMHKVPSLIGLIYTAPYMSDGCAPTLEARFDDVACGGGDKHGNVAALTQDERDALLAYLKTL